MPVKSARNGVIAVVPVPAALNLAWSVFLASERHIGIENAETHQDEILVRTSNQHYAHTIEPRVLLSMERKVPGKGMRNLLH